MLRNFKSSGVISNDYTRRKSVEFFSRVVSNSAIDLNQMRNRYFPCTTRQPTTKFRKNDCINQNILMQQQRQQQSKPQPLLTCQLWKTNFSTMRLVPPSVNNSLKNNCVNHIDTIIPNTTIRFMTSNSSRSKDKDSNSSSSSIPSEESPKTQAESTTNLASNMGERIEAAMNWRISDLMGVWGAGLLFVGILVSPVVADKMKSSNRSYDIDEITDDDMTALTRQVLDYMKEVNEENGGITTGEKSNVIVDASSDLVSRVLQTDIVQDALIKLSVKVLQSPEVLQATQILVRNLFHDLISDPDTLTQIVDLLNMTMKDEKIRKAVVDLVVQLTADEEVNRAVTKMVVALGQEEEIQAATQALLKESAHQTLNDPDILYHSMEFAADVVGDDVVQRTSGVALWNTINYSFRPGFTYVISALGLSLVCFSMYLLGPGISSSLPSAEERLIASSLSSLGSDLYRHLISGLSDLLKLPTRILFTAGNALLNAVVAPFRIVGNKANNVVNGISQGVQLAAESISSVVSSIVARGYSKMISKINDNMITPIVSMISSSMIGIAVKHLTNGIIHFSTDVKDGFLIIGNVLMIFSTSLFNGINHFTTDVRDGFIIIGNGLGILTNTIVDHVIHFGTDVGNGFIIIGNGIASLTQSCIQKSQIAYASGKNIVVSWSWNNLLASLSVRSKYVYSRLSENLVFIWSWCLMKLKRSWSSDVDGKV